MWSVISLVLLCLAGCAAPHYVCQPVPRIEQPVLLCVPLSELEGK